jgi:hypothetical protein
VSLLFSDSIADIIDVNSLEDEGFDFLGKIDVNGTTYAIDGFITDRKSVRVYASGNPNDAISILNLRENADVKIELADGAFVASGRIAQVGYEFLPRGGRVIISMIVRDK